MKLLAALCALALAGVVTGLAVAGASSVSTPQLPSDAIVPPDKAAAVSDRMPSAPVDASQGAASSSAPAFVPDPIPAELLGSDVPAPVPASVITTTNGWLVSNGYSLVAVYAGSAGNDPTQGRVVIVRQDLRTGKQTMQIVDAGATGPLTVAAGAPTGAAVETSALTGRLDLTTTSGVIRHLDLTANAISAK